MTDRRRIQALRYLADGFLGGTALFFLAFAGWLFLPDLLDGIEPGEWLVYVLGALLLLSSLPGLYGHWKRYTADRTDSQQYREERYWPWRIGTAVLVGGLLVGVELVLWFGFRSFYDSWWGVPIPFVVGGLGWAVCSSLAERAESNEG